MPGPEIIHLAEPQTLYLESEWSEPGGNDIQTALVVRRYRRSCDQLFRKLKGFVGHKLVSCRANGDR